MVDFMLLRSRSALAAHRAPIPEEEPIPGEEPVPDDDPAPHPDPVVREPGEPPPMQLRAAALHCEARCAR